MVYNGSKHLRGAAERVDDLLVRLSTGQLETDATLGEFFDQWLEARQTQLATSTWHSYRRVYTLYIRPHLAELTMREVTVTTVSTWMAMLLSSGGARGQPLAAATVRYARLLLHKAFEDAVRSGALMVNPVSRTENPYRDINGVRVRYPPASWTVEELRVFLDRVDRHQHGPLFTLAAMTGMRRGEALALTWSDIDIDRSELVISRNLTEVDGAPVLGTTKNGKTRRIALGTRALDALHDERDRQASARARAGTRWRNEPDFVFTRPTGDFVRPTVASDAFRTFVGRLPVRRIRFHDLRHTHAILLLHAGTPVVDVSHRLGHADPGVTLKLYAQALHDPGHALAEKFDRLLDNRMWATTEDGKRPADSRRVLPRPQSDFPPPASSEPVDRTR
ncbi:tyrosine-type recombinase/integrase [Nitriliruptor alkaliphilus]|uniref:tyrosine-type recombinase/integrase n=1 Tax=Nitriliruptor alkaliphilus TaxID=427918 RepID=UPI000698C273|nr:site-specific integrase [Nitriliruptor alkaliphilus]